MFIGPFRMHWISSFNQKVWNMSVSSVPVRSLKSNTNSPVSQGELSNDAIFLSIDTKLSVEIVFVKKLSVEIVYAKWGYHIYLRI